MRQAPSLVPAGATTPTASEHLVLTGEIARGAMARVFAAEDRRARRRVVVKRLDEELAHHAEYRASFLAEAQITGRLAHPSVVPVHEVGVMDDGVPYFTMDEVRGRTLAAWLCDPRRRVGSELRLREGIGIVLEVCDVIAYAHERGVIHRDLKPDNVLVSDHGRVYLIDWGLARLRGRDRIVVDRPCDDYVGAVGTPRYMSPEQAHGNPLAMDERSDIFGLGAILYEILSGCTPYGTATDNGTLLLRAWNADVVPIEQVMHGAPPPRALDVVRKALDANPDARQQSVAELRDDLRELLALVCAREPRDPARPPRCRLRRARVVAGLRGVLRRLATAVRHGVAQCASAIEWARHREPSRSTRADGRDGTRGARPGDHHCTANSRTASGIPFKVWMPRSSNWIPEPRTRSRTVLETSTSPGEAEP